MNDNNIIFVSGHKNPDIDSVASAYALALLRSKQNPTNQYIPICPGRLSERAAALFKKFGIKPPISKHDVFVRAKDILITPPFIYSGTTLFDAVKVLRLNNILQIPIIDKNKRYLGMLSSLSLLSYLLNIDDKPSDTANITSSIKLISHVLDAEILNDYDADKIQHFDIYVAAMNQEGFENYLPNTNTTEHAIIVGNRPEIHLSVVSKKSRLMIVTGESKIDPIIIREAKAQNVSILKTTLNIASVIRRLKFSLPVEYAHLNASNLQILKPGDKISDFRKRLLRSESELFPIIDENNIFLGAIYKKTLSEQAPFKMILVDHNEIEQSPAGAAELSIIEVVDHHRIGNMRTNEPIRFTGDIVGSTCTLVAEMYRMSGEKPSKELAGILLGGLIADTLDLKSPTTSLKDHEICKWLEKLANIKADDLMNEIMQVESALTRKSAEMVITEDCKYYNDGRFKFALAQIEEANFELLSVRKQELLEEMKTHCKREGLDFFALMVTDAIREKSKMLFFGDMQIFNELPYERENNGLLKMPNVLSRKKQLLPQILDIVHSLQNE